MIVNIPPQHRDLSDFLEDWLAQQGFGVLPIAMARRVDEIEAKLSSGVRLTDVDYDDLDAILMVFWTGPIAEYHQRKVYA
ncbi:hypothetical protein [Bradyrhizobium elkanii]